MTPAAILAQLPNGFHDASLVRLEVDFSLGKSTLELSVLVGTPRDATEEQREAERKCRLRFSGLSSLVVERPGPGNDFSLEGGVDVDGGFGAYPGDPAAPDDGLVRLWFYVSTWNSRMLFAATNCELEWKE